MFLAIGAVERVVVIGSDIDVNARKSDMPSLQVPFASVWPMFRACVSCCYWVVVVNGSDIDVNVRRPTCPFVFIGFYCTSKCLSH